MRIHSLPPALDVAGERHAAGSICRLVSQPARAIEAGVAEVRRCAGRLPLGAAFCILR
jgi:hypothetical protein